MARPDSSGAKTLRRERGRRRIVLLALAAGLGATQALGQASPEQRFPDVLAVEVRAARAGVFDLEVTVSSPCDTPARYADSFRVTTRAGRMLGERRLVHDHQGEQPFTRELYGVRVPDGIEAVVVQARDQ